MLQASEPCSLHEPHLLIESAAPAPAALQDNDLAWFMAPLSKYGRKDQ
jgi:hypothetical protein